MKRISLYIIGMSFSLLACSPAPIDRSSTKIVGGSLVTDPSDPTFKSTLALFSSSGGLCTGTLIGPNQVLTAAHCIDNSRIELNFGTDPRPIPGLKVIGARKHPLYRPHDDVVENNDVAIVVFEGTLPAGLVPVRIASLTGIEDGVSVILAGYGVTGQNIKDAGTLRKTKAKIKQFVTEDKEFAMQEGLGTGSCFGDSGGPAYIEQNGTLSVIGATSRGENCDSGDGIYGDVRYFQGWYKCTAKEFGKPLKYLANDSSNTNCKPNTIDNDVEIPLPIATTSNPQVTAPAIPAMIGEPGTVPNSFTLYFSTESSSSIVTYCLGTKEVCSQTTAPWVSAVKDGSVGARAKYKTPQPLTLQNNMQLAVKSQTGTNTVTEHMQFKQK